jgi:ATP-binding cassette, subfamily B, bacterial
MADVKINPVQRIFEVLKFQKKDISAIYFYAILSGLVQLSLPLGTQSIINFVMGGFFSTSLILLIVFVVAGVFAYGFMQINQMKLIEKIQQQIFVRYAFQFTYAIPHLNLKSVDNYYLPELVNRFFDTMSLQKGISKLLLEIPTATIQILFGLLLLSFYHPAFILFGLLLVTILYFILRFTGIKGLQTSLQQSDYKYRVASWIEELARAVTSFKFSKGAPIHLEKADTEITGYLNAKTSHFKVLLSQYWVLVIFKVLITAALLIVGSLLLVEQQINIGQFIGAELVILLVISSVEKLIINLDKVYEVLTAVEKLAKVTDQPFEANGNLQLIKEEGIAIKVQNLSFTYPDGKQVLHNISFEVKKGETVCINGSNSSGKSTLLRVLSGAYQPFEGIINFNNISVSNYDLATVRANTGIMLNTQHIFEASLLDNITMGNPGINIASIQKLVDITGLNTFIQNDKEGYERKLHPTGQRLSQAVVQKILLVRALINNPVLLLLEEPFALLTEEETNNVCDYLFTHPARPTIIAVSSNKTFMQRCQQRLVLDRGRLVQNMEM